MDVKGDSGETSERKKESWRESLHLLREHLNDHQQNVRRNVNVKDYSGEISSKNEEQVIGNWRKGDLYYTGAKNLAELCSSVL